MPPLVSVIIPTYERSTLLRQTVDSALVRLKVSAVQYDALSRYHT